MRFGTFHLVGAPDMAPAERRFGETLDQIALADEVGLDYAWVAEHHFSNYGYSVNPLILIAKASAVARRVRFGQSVLVTPFWHPIRLAEDIALTDILTDGRLDVGVGRGYQGMEFDGFNVPMAESREIFAEQMELMRKAWTEDDFTYEGKHFPVSSPITVLPRPLQKPHPPIWLAAQSPQSLDWAAENGHRVMMTGGGTTSRETIADWTRRYKERSAATGHEDARVGLLRFVYVADSDEDARAAVWQTRWQSRLAAHLRQGDERIANGQNESYPFEGEVDDAQWWDRLIYGTPDRCIAQLRRDAEMGVTDFLGWFDVGGLDHQKVQRSMRMFAREVLPALSGATVAGPPCAPLQR